MAEAKRESTASNKEVAVEVVRKDLILDLF